ncbi:MAG: T9SS type A sorting domain-containing protein [Bacteroidota bacterium]
MDLQKHIKQDTKKKGSFFRMAWKFMVVAMLLFAGNSFGQAVSEDFEGAIYPPSGWTASNNTGVPWAAHANASGYGVGSSSTFIDFYDISAGSEQLNTYAFAPSAAGDLLVFTEAYAAYQNSDDQLEVLTSSDGGATYTQLILLHGGDTGPLNTGGDVTNGYFVPTSTQWQTFTFVLPAGTNMVSFNAISAYGNNLFLDNIQVNQQCTGTPSAGAAICFAGPVCPFNMFHVILVGADNTPGLTYQWQSSSDNILFSDIVGANSSILTVAQNNTTYYQCVITCSNTGMTATSTSVEVDVTVLGLPLLQNFESGIFPDNCWSESANSAYPWRYSTNASANGDGSASAMFDYWDLPSGNDVLTSAQFMPTPPGYFLYFDEAYATAFNSDDQLEVLYSTDGGTSFTQLALLDGGDNGPLNTGGDITGGPFVPNSGQWKSFSYPLPIGTNMVQFNAISAYGNNLYLDNVKVYVPIPCSGIPTAGVTTSGSNPVGQNVVFKLTLAGAENTDGLTYQWQSSPDGITYSDITGAIAKYYSTSGTMDTWYQCVLTCSNSSLTSISTPLLEQEHLGFTWTPVAALAPHPNMGITLLLSDGSVMCKTNAGGSDGIGTIWDILKPDIHGSYVNGTWSSTSPMVRSRYAFSSDVMMDGRVYAAGGEYGTDGTQAGKHGEVYDPLTDVWTECIGPGHTMSDGNSIMLDNGNVLQALVYDYYNLRHTTIYNPTTNTYTPGPDCRGVQNESMWLKLADNSILFVEMPRLDSSYTYTSPFHSERYIPSLNQWISDSDVPVALYDPYGYETGPAFLLPDGRSFFIGSTGHTAYYTPSGGIAPGTWAAGPDLPNDMGMPDGPGSSLTNGNILFACSQAPYQGNNFPAPTYFYEFNYQTNTFTQLNAPTGNPTLSAISQQVNFLNLPDGSIFMSFNQDASSSQYYVYTPSGSQLSERAPVIGHVVQSGCTNFMITGTGFNGINQGSAFGDENQNDSNYPVIRLTQGPNVYYVRTFNWNSTGVQRGSAADTTHFTLPAGLPFGTYNLVVTANGLASASVPFIYNPAPSPAISGATVICNNNPVVLSSSGYASYSWSNGGTNQSIAASVAGTYSVTVTNSVGCTGTTSATVTASTQTIPVITASGPTSICTGGSVTLTTGAYAGYSWSNGGTGASINVNSGGIYTVTVHNAAGCTNSAQRTITALASPMPNILTTGLNTFCGGGSATLSVGTGFASYAWSNAAITPSISVNASGTYTVTVTSTNGCTGTSAATVSNACNAPTSLATTNIASTTAVANWVQPSCYVGYTVRISKHLQNNWTNYTVAPNTHFTFSGLARNTQYDWQIRTNCNAAQTNTSAFSPSQTFSTLPRLEGSADGMSVTDFTAYPNPASDKVTITFNSDNGGNYNLRFTDLAGRTIINESHQATAGNNQFEIGLASVAKGLYLVTIQNEEGILQTKIVVQ